MRKPFEARNFTSKNIQYNNSISFYLNLFIFNIYQRRYPLMASASDDGTIHVFHCMVYRLVYNLEMPLCIIDLSLTLFYLKFYF